MFYKKVYVSRSIRLKKGYDPKANKKKLLMTYKFPGIIRALWNYRDLARQKQFTPITLNGITLLNIIPAADIRVFETIKIDDTLLREYYKQILLLPKNVGEIDFYRQKFSWTYAQNR